MGKEFYDLKNLRQSLERLVAINIKQGLIRQAGAVTIILFWIAQILILLVGGRSVLRDELTVGELFAITAYFGRVCNPVDKLVSLHLRIPSIMVAARRVFAFFDEHKEESQEGTPIEQIQGRVQFSDVSFAYNNNQSVLKQVSFQAEPGETIAVVGPSGAGKSTLVNLFHASMNSNRATY